MKFNFLLHGATTREIRSYDIKLGYVPSDQNPADIASRGEILSKLERNQLWWKGPDWLLKVDKEWPIACYKVTEEVSLDINTEVKVKQRIFEMGMVFFNKGECGPFACRLTFSNKFFA